MLGWKDTEAIENLNTLQANYYLIVCKSDRAKPYPDKNNCFLLIQCKFKTKPWEN